MGAGIRAGGLENFSKIDKRGEDYSVLKSIMSFLQFTWILTSLPDFGLVKSCINLLHYLNLQIHVICIRRSLKEAISANNKFLQYVPLQIHTYIYEII